MESNSSKNKIHGLAAWALSKSSRTLCSEAPIYLFKISGPLMEIKFNPHWPAIALANNVLPHPGYPYSKIPDLKRNGQLANIGAYLVGHSKVSNKMFFASFNPPISDQLIDDFCNLTPRKLDGV